MTPAARIKSLQSAIQHIERAMQNVHIAGPFYELKQATDELYALLEDARDEEFALLPQQETLPL